MSNIIIGTAGHIDHGKTALIRALNGFEGDSTNEENKEESQLIYLFQTSLKDNKILHLLMFQDMKNL